MCDCVWGVEMGDRLVGVWVSLGGPAAWGGVRGCCCFCVRAWYRCSRTILIMASRTISQATTHNMQLDKLIDNYLNFDNSS